VHRLARRSNALVLLDDGMSCEAIAKVLFLDNDTIRTCEVGAWIARTRH
jgi:DNA-binding NarL/FixJ family response regulator